MLVVFNFPRQHLSLIICLVNCQKACKKCDDYRPCERCRKYGLEDSCRDSARKERKKGNRRGPYSRSQDDSDSEESDAGTSSRWSDDTKNDEVQYDNSVGKPLSLKLKFQETGKQNKNEYYWNMPSRSSTNTDRPIRAARSRAVKLSEEWQRDGNLMSNRYSEPTRSVIHVGVPDSSYIKALGAVCTDVLRKLEEEDMPPAVTFSEWPPKFDPHFVPVSFMDHRMISSYSSASHHNSISLMQPTPMTRPIRPLPSSTMKMIERTNCDGLITSSPIASPGSSSPNSPLYPALTPLEHIMTPPETPVSDYSAPTEKKLHLDQVPANIGLSLDS